MNINEIEAMLRAILPGLTVSQLEDFPCTSYREFLDAHRNGKVEVLTRFDGETVDVLGTGAEKFMHYALSWTPFFIAVALLILSFVLWNFWLLVGIPLALLGFFLSSPVAMKSIGSPVLLVVGIYFVYSWIEGHQTATFLSGAYAVSTFLLGVSRKYCDTIARRAIEKSELVLIWLVLKKVVIVRARHPAYSVNPPGVHLKADDIEHDPHNSELRDKIKHKAAAHAEAMVYRVL